MTIQELYDKPSRWTQRAFARYKGGKIVTAPIRSSSKAACFCLAGAMQKCYPDYAVQVAARRRLVKAINELFPGFYADPTQTNLVPFNDSEDRTFADIVQVVRRARV